MLDEICPVQFVEGVNEWAEASNSYVNTSGCSYVAIEYIPKLSYSLKRFDIFLTHQEPPVEDKYRVAVCAGYDDNPSDIILCQGEWVCNPVLAEWQEVELEKPAVVLRDKKYWLIIDLRSGNIGLPIAKRGDEYALRFRTDGGWITWDIAETDKVMLRFYGRILPISG